MSPTACSGVRAARSGCAKSQCASTARMRLWPAALPCSLRRMASGRGCAGYVPARWRTFFTMIQRSAARISKSRACIRACPCFAPFGKYCPRICARSSHRRCCWRAVRFSGERVPLCWWLNVSCRLSGPCFKTARSADQTIDLRVPVVPVCFGSRQNVRTVTSSARLRSSMVTMPRTSENPSIILSVPSPRSRIAVLQA